MKGIGNPSTYPEIPLKEAGRPKIGDPFEITSVTPRNMVFVPRVTTKGCRSSALIKTPFTAPSTREIRSPARIAAGTGTFAFSIIAIKVPTSAATEPTDKSIPASKIAKNSPNARSMYTVLCRPICFTLSGVMKYFGDAMDRQIIIKIKILNVPNLSQKLLNFALVIFSPLNLPQLPQT